MHYAFPSPFEKVYKCRVKQEHTLKIVHSIESRIDERVPDDSENTQMVTGDTNLIAIQMEVQYRIIDPQAYIFYVEEPSRLISKASESVLTEIIGKMSVDDVLTTGKRVIVQKFKEKVQKILDHYKCGVIVTNVQITNIGAARKVLEAFNAVAQASSISRTEINRALGYKNTVIPNALAEANRLIQDASSYKNQKIKTAQGEAGNFLFQLSEYASSPEKTKRRIYLEKMQNILQKCRKVIFTPDAGGKIHRVKLWMGE
jgi:membrane protease subunit HflK